MLLALKYLFIFILQQLANNAVAGHFKRKEKQKKEFFSARKKEIKPENAKAMSNWFRNATTWNTRTMAMQVKYLIRYNISVVAVFSVRFFSFSSIYYHFAYLHAQIK